jgi:ribosomal protein S12 methylthiotransferase
MLPELLESLCAISEVRLIRILYVYADGISDELIKVMSSNKKIARYLDMPVQHGSDKILQKMNRHDSVDEILTTMAKLRNSMPDIILRSTVMVGFPGELSDDFTKLMNFLKIAKFDRLGCFIFSPEEGTPAINYKPRVRADVAKRRYEKVMTQQQQISLQSNLARIGTTISVTLESVAEDGIFYIGRSYGEAPDVDPVIYVIAEKEMLELGNTYEIRILDAGEYDLTGVTVS